MQTPADSGYADHAEIGYATNLHDCSKRWLPEHWQPATFDSPYRQPIVLWQRHLGERCRCLDVAGKLGVEGTPLRLFLAVWTLAGWTLVRLGGPKSTVRRNRKTIPEQVLDSSFRGSSGSGSPFSGGFVLVVLAVSGRIAVNPCRVCG